LAHTPRLWSLFPPPCRASFSLIVLSRRFLNPFNIDCHEIVAGISVSVAMAPGDGISSQKLPMNANMARFAS
jgi:hypothetical protein